MLLKSSLIVLSEPDLDSPRAACVTSSPRFGFAAVGEVIVRTKDGFLLWLTPAESALIRQLLAERTPPHSIDVAEWLDPATDALTIRLAVLPGLIARGVVTVTSSDGTSRICLSIPPDVNGDGDGPSRDLSSAPPPAGQDSARQSVVQADLLGAVVRARGGRWLLRSDPVPSTSGPGRAARGRRIDDPGGELNGPPAPSADRGFFAHSTSWRGGSSDRTVGRLLGLVDVDEGIIAAIRHGSGLPSDIPVWYSGPNRALSTAHPSGLTWRCPGSSMGKGLTHDEARLSALAEAAERWSGTWQESDATPHRTGMWLMHEGARVEAFGDSLQRAQPWLSGRDLISGSEVWVPAARVLMGHPPVADSVLHTDSNGLAAGITLADARLQALLEVVERDAISRWWHQEAMSELLHLPRDDAMAPFQEWLDWLGLRIDLRRLDSLEGTVTLLALGWLPATGRIVYGAGAHIDPRIAYRRAMLELVQSAAAALHTARELSPWAGLAPSPHVTAAAAGTRAHLDLGTPASGETLRGSEAIASTLTSLAQSLAAAGHRAVAVDVTRPQVGVPVARVVVPGQRGMPAPMR